MGLLSFLRGDDIGQKAITGTPALLETLATRQFAPYISLGGSNIGQQRLNAAYVEVQNSSLDWIYRNSPDVRAVVDYIARCAGELGLKLYERVGDDERQEAGDHPAAYSLRNPNPRTPGPYFIQQMFVSLLVYYNAYALKFRNPSTQKLTFSALPTHRVGLLGTSFYEVDAYRVWRSDGTYFDVQPKDMIHWRGTNACDPRRGESPIETLREDIAAAFASRSALVELYGSGLALPGWIERPIEAPELSREAMQRLEEDVARMAKASKRRIPIFEEGMAFKQAGVTPEDAEMLAARRQFSELVASLYGMKHVPPETVEEQQQFLADVLPPLLKMAASFLNLQVLQEEYGLEDYYFEFNLDEKLMGPERLKALTAASGRPVLLTNEARAMINEPPVDGGDELVTPANVIVGDNPKPSPQVMPIQDPNKPPQDGSYRTDQPNTPIPSRASLNGNGHYKHKPLAPVRARTDERRDRWAAKKYRPILEKHFERQARLFKSKSLKAIDARWNTELADDLEAAYGEHFAHEGDQWAFRMAFDFDPGKGQNWLKVKAQKTAEGINATTQQKIDELGPDEAFTQAKTVRAGAAAMLMAGDVAAFASKVATEQAPGERLVTIDGGDCEVCAEFQGTWPASEVPGWPAYHPACNCTATPS